jgi:TRAP-type C4-dicarboxylate transport system permease small subunit
MDREKTLISLQKVDKSLTSSVQVICVAIMAFIVILITASIFTRFVFFYPLNFPSPLAKYLMMWMIFLGSGLAARTGEHIAIDMFSNKFKGRAQKRLLIVVNIFVSVFLLIVVFNGFSFAMSGLSSNDPIVFGISMIIPYLSVPIGALYILVQLNLSTFIHVLNKEN